MRGLACVQFPRPAPPGVLIKCRGSGGPSYRVPWPVRGRCGMDRLSDFHAGELRELRSCGRFQVRLQQARQVHELRVGRQDGRAPSRSERNRGKCLQQPRRQRHGRQPALRGRSPVAARLCAEGGQPGCMDQPGYLECGHAYLARPAQRRTLDARREGGEREAKRCEGERWTVHTCQPRERFRRPPEGGVVVRTSPRVRHAAFGCSPPRPLVT